MSASEQSEQTPSAPVARAASGQSLLRASDADRDRVADRLRDALGEGRLTPEEHHERVEAVYLAKTYAELEPIVDDLPGGTGGVGAAGTADHPTVSLRKGRADTDAGTAPERPPETLSTSMVAICSGAERRGRWLVEPTTQVSVVCGGAELDFRRAVLSQREVTVNITCVCGGVEVIVPPGVRVRNEVTSIMGGVDQAPDDDDSMDPDAPVIRLSGVVVCGGISVTRKVTGETRADRRRDRRDARRDRGRPGSGHERHRPDGW